MAHNVVHFAVHAEDVERARRFYEGVFGWRFTPWGPPGFYLIETGTKETPGIHGALQQRREPVSGSGVVGYECSIVVDDLPAVRAAVVEHGGTLVMEPTEIPTVGTLIQFRDTEGNVACAIDYVPERRRELAGRGV